MKENWPDDADLPSAARAEMGAAVRQRLARNPMVSRIQTDKAEMFLRHGLLSPQECTQLMALVDEEAKPSKLFSGSANPDYRTSSSGDMRVDNPLVQLVTKRIDTLMGIDTKQGELLQGQRYEPGQEYKVHCDYFPAKVHYWPQMRKSGGQRVWTTMVYLCDVEEGGETHFPRLGLKVPPRRGTLLIWNNMRPDGSPNGETIHAALPVVRGRKYVMTKWYRERPWLSIPTP
ncbi:MAG: 2OG-Fe(II) oxygenase [Sphingobium sp.]|nr:2OG-Fe(II) oxygenase [Sphingobium sp.]